MTRPALLTLPQAPAWLPYRWRAAVDNYRIRQATAGVDRTRPVAAADPPTAAAEVHMLLCRRDVRIGVVALKSLLRFAPGRLAVTLTDDGSVTAGQRAWVDRHVPGCRWLPRRVDDPAFRATLARHPRLEALYDGDFHMISKLLHPVLLARSPRSVALDADTAFARPPELLLRWAESDDESPHYLHDHRDETQVVGADARRAFAELAAALSPDGRTWGLGRYFFNAGLLLYRPTGLDLGLAEAYLRWLDTRPAADRRGPLSVWFGDWTREQMCYMTMFAFARPPAQPLGDDYHLGGGTGFAFNHFLRHYLIQTPTLRGLRQLISELP